jgi:hypothetical protein
MRDHIENAVCALVGGLMIAAPFALRMLGVV